MRCWGVCLPAVMVLFACQPNTSGIAETSASNPETSSGSEESGVSTEESGDCIGEADCACTDEGSCDPGLDCIEGICEPETSGDGDGDGPGDGDGDESCSQLGCMCDGSAESCDPGLSCVEGLCAAGDSCGDGVLDEGELCDDGNDIGGDGCDTDCSPTTVEVAVGGAHACALIEGGRVRCWGAGVEGALGYGNDFDIGDDEDPAAAGDLGLPFSARALSLGNTHSCALFDDQALRCWGEGANGRLGNLQNVTIGDDESVADLPVVAIGGTPLALGSGNLHNCVLLEGGDLRCFGGNAAGQLGLGTNVIIGDNEAPEDGPLVDVGQPFTVVGVGAFHSCGLTESGSLYCWGENGHGQLGYGSNQDLGNDEPVDSEGPVDVYPADLADDASITQIALGKDHSCVLFSTGEVLCWGRASRGELGQGNKDEWGNQGNEAPSDLAPIELGGSALAITAGGEFSCALLEGGVVRCWGKNDTGQLGLGNTVDIGDNELPNEVAPVELGRPALSIASGDAHSCAVLDDFTVRCWGRNGDGRLGLGDSTENVGDDELPIAVDPISLL